MKSRHLSQPKRKAEFIEPMECAPVTKLLDEPGWFYEIKFDGYRAYPECVVRLFLRLAVPSHMRQNLAAGET
jgi:ATP-dependent DNA ligase